MDTESQTRLYQAANIGTFQKFSEAWLACMEHVLTNGHEVMDGETRLREALNVSVSACRSSINDLTAAGANADRLKLMLLKYRSQSVLPQYKISYGRLFRDHSEVNQIVWLVDRLRSNPDSKSATIGFHVPGEQELSCISLLDCKIRNDALHLTSIFRSQNVYASQPGNACALYELQQEIANNLSISVGVLTLHIISAHIYQDDWRAAHEAVARNAGYGSFESSGHYRRSRGGRHHEASK